MIKAKDTWSTIEQLGPEAKTSVTGDGIASGKVVESNADRVTDAKARTIIMGYCGQEALSRILHLSTAKEQ